MPQLDLTLVDSSTLGHKIQAPKKVHKISFTELGASFIPFAIIIIFVYSTILPYNSNLNLLLRTRFGFDAVTAGKIIVRYFGLMLFQAYPTLFMNFFCPLIGVLSDRSGKRGTILIFAVCCLMSSHLFLAFLPTCPTSGTPDVKAARCRDDSLAWLMVPQILFLIGYSTFAANVWAMLRLIQHKHTRAMALGVSNSVQNGSYLLSNLMIAGVLDAGARSPESYVQVSLMMAVLNGVSVLTQVVWGCKEGHRLNFKKRKTAHQ